MAALTPDPSVNRSTNGGPPGQVWRLIVGAGYLER